MHQPVTWHQAYINADVLIEGRDGEMIAGRIISLGNKRVEIQLANGKKVKRYYKDVYFAPKLG